jgi:hypothetical protein
MEHGAVVLAYDCPSASACPEISGPLEAFAAAYPEDTRCIGTGRRHRLIVVPDPTLDIPVAAAAWGHGYRAHCVDDPSLRAFVDAHYGLAPEDFCSPGIDRSAEGWCPIVIP